MSKTKFKAFRRVLNIETFTSKGVTFKQVTWCIITRETSRAIYSDHIGITTYANSVNNRGFGARMSRKAVNVAKVDLSQAKQSSLTQAYWNALRGNRKGVISWFDEKAGVGFVRDNDSNELVAVYACNVKGANSHYPELTTNVTLSKGTTISFILMDYHTTMNCGACGIEIVSIAASNKKDME